jgi:hypothetical protein
VSYINNPTNGHGPNTTFFMSKSLDFFKQHIDNPIRVKQAETLDSILNEHFKFDYVECIETGCSYGGYDDFGTYLGNLHGWLEFSAIKDKMPSGSICIIDDNYFNGTTVYWNIFNNGTHVNTLPIDVTYDVIGKGSLVYHWVKNYTTDWELIGDHYYAGLNVKLIFKKK